MLPVLEELNGLLFYPVQYEGEESSRNVFYTGAAPNQQAIPAVDYFLEELGVEKFALLGTDYVYPRTTNNILQAYLMSKGIAEEDIFVNYTPFGHSDWSTIVSDVVELASDGSQVGVISTINGDANVGFYKELAAAGRRRPTTSPSSPSRSARRNSRASTPRTSSGTWRPGTTSCPPTRPRTPTSSQPGTTIIGDDSRVTNDPMEAHYIGFHMWVQAVEAGRHHRRRRRASTRWSARPSRTSPAAPPRCCRTTT